jgi:hypothetical protein
MCGSRPSHAKKLSSTTCASVWEPPGLRPEALKYDVRQCLGAPIATPISSQVRRAPVIGSSHGYAQKLCSATCANVWEPPKPCKEALKYDVRHCLGAARATPRSSQVRRAPMFGSSHRYAQKLSSTTCASDWELSWLRPEALQCDVRQCLGAARAMQRSSQVRRAPVFGSRQGYAQKLSSTTCASVWELPWLRPEALKYDVRQCLGALMATP